jgi:ribosomal protein S18 acetylase RimI-like enzyme
VLALLKSAALWLRERDIDYWQNWLEPPAHHLAWVDEGLVAGQFRIVDVEGAPAGCLRLQPDDEMFWGRRDDSAGYVHFLTVDRALAGRGLGRLILDAVAGDLEASGASFLRLDCGVGVVGLRRYYESCGFVAVSEATVDGEDHVLYERALCRSFDR